MQQRYDRRPAVVELALPVWLWLGLCLLGWTDSACVVVQAADWPQFRNGSAQGHGLVDLSGAVTPPITADTAPVWETIVPGSGWSSPVVAGSQVWVSSALKKGTELRGLCFDRQTGAKVHSTLIRVIEHPTEIHADNSHASPTPCVDAQRCYVHFGTAGTAAIDCTSGEIVWQRLDLPCEHQGGPGSSPVLFENLVIITLDGADRQSVIALDAATGRTVWQRERSAPFRAAIETHRAFATPVIMPAEVPLLLSTGADQTHAYEARTGTELWQVRYTGFSNVPAPVFDAERVYLGTGFYDAGLWAVRTGGRGDVTTSHVAWKFDGQASTIPTPLLSHGRLFVLSEKGILNCVDPVTGALLYRERLGGKYSASPVGVGSWVLLASEAGKLTWLDATAEAMTVVGEAKLTGPLKATPAICDDFIVVRTELRLYAFATRPIAQR